MSDSRVTHESEPVTAFRTLRPGGSVEVAGQADTGEYQKELLAAGFIEIAAANGTVRAVKPPAPPGVTIRPMRESDAGGVLAIYQAGIDGGQASFETEVPTWEEFDRAKLPLHRHVAESNTGDLLGWVAAIPTSSRCAYAGVVEHSVYVDPAAHGRGIGGALLHALIGSTESAGIWTVQSGVFPENTASLRLHERAGFRVVGTRTRVGRHHGSWRDVVLIERRSAVVGTD
ncbi:MAG TPA: GNAT family N-acetyltransferase [Actinoallomurus sp.]|nr:GNAT family N-acetyltransferase [Actinoallomurus sp.]